MSTGPAYAQVAQLHRLAARQAGARVRPLADGDGEVVALPTTELARVRRRHERDGVLPDPVECVVCDFYGLDAGRIQLTVADQKLGWVRGTELDIRRVGDRLTITALADGEAPRGQVKKVGAGGRLGLPKGLRTQIGLAADATAGVFTDLAARQVVVVDPRRLAAFVIDSDREQEH